MTPTERQLLTAAKKLLSQRLKIPNGLQITKPDDLKTYLQLKFEGRMGREHMDVLLFDSQNRLLKHENLFAGTLDACAIYPREIAVMAVKTNARNVVVAHNHPSMDPKPSEADIKITKRIKDALNTLDIQLLDHFIVGESVVSFAELNLL